MKFSDMIANKDGTISVTKVAFVVGFLVVNIKLLFSGFVIGKFIFPEFGGSDYALIIAALGSTYVFRAKDTNTTVTKE